MNKAKGVVNQMSYEKLLINEEPTHDIDLSKADLQSKQINKQNQRSKPSADNVSIGVHTRGTSDKMVKIKSTSETPKKYGEP